MDYPRIYLAVDTCFASKRWTSPSEWMEEVASFGLQCIEASADTELDPFYMGEGYLQDWVGAVREAGARTGCRVVNLYSGHGSYSTTGLAHTDARVRDRMLRGWLGRMAALAGELGAGLGFYCHAFSDSVLQSPERYLQAGSTLIQSLAQLASIAESVDCGPVGIEQMYSPHQIPWTIDGTASLLRRINLRSPRPFYITIDVGHQSGQRKFQRPTREELARMLAARRAGSGTSTSADGPRRWLGSRSAFDLFDTESETPARSDTAVLDALGKDMDKHHYLFSKQEDSDTYAWLERLGRYSPIVHLQQTSGTASAHWPFTEEYNARGIIEPAKVLAALRRSFENALPDEGMPQPCRKIYLTLEIFSSTSDIPPDIRSRMRESVRFWRHAVPEDGLSLDTLV